MREKLAPASAAAGARPDRHRGDGQGVRAASSASTNRFGSSTSTYLRDALPARLRLLHRELPAHGSRDHRAKPSRGRSGSSRTTTILSLRHRHPAGRAAGAGHGARLDADSSCRRCWRFHAIPFFLLGLLLIYVLAFQAAAGSRSLAATAPGTFPAFNLAFVGDVLQHSILPALSIFWSPPEVGRWACAA